MKGQEVGRVVVGGSIDGCLRGIPETHPRTRPSIEASSGGDEGIQATSNMARDWDPKLQGEREQIQNMKQRKEKKATNGKKKVANTTKFNWYKKEEPPSKGQSYKKGGNLRPKQGVG